MNFFYTDENSDSFKFLVRVNQQCETIWNYYFKIVMGGFIVFVPTMALVSSLLCIHMKGHFDAKFVYHANKFT